MKKVYIQIVDPLNGTCISACHEYPDEHNQAVEYTLLNYGIQLHRCDLESITDEDCAIPKMPKYLLTHGTVDGTSKLISIIVVG